MDLEQLPKLNAILNACATFFLLSGYAAIRMKKIFLHKIQMASAFLCSVAFLISYLYFHFHAGHIPFKGTGIIRSVYFAILITHMILAATVPPLAVMTILRAWRGQIEKHKKIARFTLPIWLYVSITGVIIYFMVYR